MEENLTKLKKQYVFQMSSLNAQERTEYCHLIKKLGTSIYIRLKLFLLVVSFKTCHYYNILEYKCSISIVCNGETLRKEHVNLFKPTH